MSKPYDIPSNCFTCPYCKAEDQGVYNEAYTGPYYTGECQECNKTFNVDVFRDVFYDDKGDTIK